LQSEGIVAAELHSVEEWRSEFVGPLLRVMEAGQCPEWRDISDRSPFYKSYWAQWKYLVVRDGVLECHRESADRMM